MAAGQRPAAGPLLSRLPGQHSRASRHAACARSAKAWNFRSPAVGLFVSCNSRRPVLQMMMTARAYRSSNSECIRRAGNLGTALLVSMRQGVARPLQPPGAAVVGEPVGPGTKLLRLRPHVHAGTRLHVHLKQYICSTAVHLVLRQCQCSVDAVLALCVRACVRACVGVGAVPARRYWRRV